ncbi:MarR family transcriptional regulator [Rheinheimera soli]|uniref:DNA-binding MarR family transcriptional regulator n=1 Tax=Rheinheimera soli TaxID=443616 RepID=A0ABU1VZ14_9GAMM|nr:MarR family transcriptional regulator [Rheinheimera soli]MDR7120805.1 DNA-binding MarR family transcriptional regulator [Rheinheimera soli]
MPQQDLQLQQDATALYEAVNQLVRFYQFRDRDLICCHDVSVTQCYALEFLAEHGSLRLQQLAELMLLDKSTSSRVVDSLVKKGYVTRIADINDRRAVALTVTDKGVALYQQIRAELIAQEQQLIAHLSPETRQASIEVIRALTAQVKQRATNSCGTRLCSD